MFPYRPIMKRVLFLMMWLMLVFVLSGCKAVDSGAECSADDDCGVAGCSGQICATKEKAPDIITTCEWKESYACYQLTSCSCINGLCKWAETDEFISCLEK